MPLTVPAPSSVDEGPVSKSRRWKRSLRAPFVFRVMRRMLGQSARVAHPREMA